MSCGIDPCGCVDDGVGEGVGGDTVLDGLALLDDDDGGGVEVSGQVQSPHLPRPLQMPPEGGMTGVGEEEGVGDDVVVG